MARHAARYFGFSCGGTTFLRSYFLSTVVRFWGNPADAFRLLGPRGAIRLKVVPSLDESGTRTVVQLTFTGRSIRHGSLPNSQYTLTIDGDQLVDTTGQAVDGDQDGAAGGDATEALFRLHGDGEVDGADLATFLGALSKRNGEQDDLNFLNRDGDGRISRRDYRQLRRRMGSIV